MPFGKGLQEWPRGPLEWAEGEKGFISVPFTWNLPDVRERVTQGDFFIREWVVGGPAVRLLPDYLAGIAGVSVDAGDLPGVLQRANPWATRTSLGCPRKCEFCGVGPGILEGPFKTLDDWADLPVIVDSNLLATPDAHFSRVMDRLENWDEVDFNQGIDARILSPYHAERLSRLRKPHIRLAVDDEKALDPFLRAVDRLRSAGVAKSNIRAYVLVAFNADPETAWKICREVEKVAHKALPMFYHALDALQWNVVTEEQEALGWTDRERKRLMQWFYQHRESEGPRKRGPKGPKLFDD